MEQGLVDNTPAAGGVEEGQQLSQNPEYDKLVGINPGFAPVTADTEPSEEELIHFKEIYADFIEKLHRVVAKPAEKIMRSSTDLFRGVAQVAFSVLQAVKHEYERKEGPIDAAIFFGEGGMISTAVDEVFQLAMSLKIPGVDDQDQYSAAQFEVMRLVGEMMQKGQEDESVGEAQDLMLDIDEAAGATGEAEPLSGDEKDTLTLGAAGKQAPGPDELPPEGEVPPEQGLVPAGPPPGGAPPGAELPPQPPQGLI